VSKADQGYRIIHVHLPKEEFVAQIEDPIERAFYQEKPFTDIDADADCIDIYPHPEIANRINPYWIAFNRIDSPEKVFAWVQHLSKKQWFSRYHLRSLLKTLERAGFITISHDL
jgi:hypothetical protein